MTINISDLEIFEVSALPTFFNCHDDPFVLVKFRFGSSTYGVLPSLSDD